MARINLLPWRDELRKRRKTEFVFMMVGGLILAGLVMLYWHLHNESLIDHQRQRNAFLKREIAAVEKQIKEINRLEKVRNQLIARMRVIEDLQSSRPQIVHLFDEVVNTLPDGVYLDQLTQGGTSITLVGKAQSNARVSAFMRNIEASQWLANPKLAVIENKQKKGDDGLSEFRLTAKQVVPKVKEGAGK